jgi:hypothetical protein
MATVKVIDLITRAQTILQDTTAVRWTVLELQNWLNDSYREIAQARPDVKTTEGTFTCAAGTRQGISAAFPTALRIIDVTRNMAATSDKRAVRLIERNVLDDQRRNWHSETGTVNIEHWMFDPATPLSFLCYPPALNTAQLEVVYSAVPSAHTLTADNLTIGHASASTETINIADSYANAMLDYILYRAYQKDATYAANGQRSIGHLQAMQQSLGIKTTVDQAVTPETTLKST